ncbi:DUF6298 domain-containing protein [Polluticaenibacter yanchengensis]|uniref:DUF6298 domain-containing protein n=1 Tax=Polluticaenibacter yanchengensis TaxID=3014562 RepID=A0ABT4UMX9_9BACT|nr:DUF6298 domain-containing protein [Chitinophagaceae bacterium LY-5]
MNILQRCLLTATLLYAGNITAQKKEPPKPPLTIDRSGQITYLPDSVGNTIPDYSFAGYKGGNEAIPKIPVALILQPQQGDNTAYIQAALDQVAKLPVKNGWRGAVLLKAGTYNVSGTLVLNAGGVVLRGEGVNKTRIIGTGFTRQNLVEIKGQSDFNKSDTIQITDKYVPVGSFSVTLANTAGLKVGSTVFIERLSNQAWLDSLDVVHFGGGLTSLGWKPNQRNVIWDRTITAIKGNTVTLDAPITTALDLKYGGTFLQAYTWNGRIENTGIENLTLESVYNTQNPKDEDHRWMAIVIDNASNSWVRQVNTKNFAGSAVAVWQGANKITIEDVKYLNPVSEIGGQRRSAFITEGGQVLFQRLYSQNAYHDFVTGYCTPGPTAFVQCQGDQAYSFSGGLDSWSSGVLYDNIRLDGSALSLGNRGQDGQGAGWTNANSTLWQISASLVELYRPPTAQNWAFGVWAQFKGNGSWWESNNSINPQSLYYTQLAARLGKDVLKRAHLLDLPSEASSSPKVEVALELTRQAFESVVEMKQWIDSAASFNPIDISANEAKAFIYKPVEKKSVKPVNSDILQNGWLVSGNQLMLGRVNDVPWWNGSSRRFAADKMKPHITRFVPGKTGLGYTDDIRTVVDDLKEKNGIGLKHNYALWYERRRDDHERVRRIDADVWPPFYELPFARSGQGEAWDRLSKYDLTKYNHFYWNRLKQYADLADENGMILIYEGYFQHNILEAGAHYADFPWRPANNINNTPFVEPVHYAGDKRIFYDAQFYDVSNPQYRALHEAYINQCLDNFKDNAGVVHTISAEYTGPFSFVKFWLETIDAWEKRNGRNVMVALSATKDVQDSALADATLAKIVDIINIEYWHYQADGKVYAPQGGLHLAPRQHARLLKPKSPDFNSVYKSVSEYKTKYPAKAVIYTGDKFPELGWAALMAGGSLSNVPAKVKPLIAAPVAAMKPLIIGNTYALKGDNGYLVYFSAADESVQIDLSAFAKQQLTAYWINERSGEFTTDKQLVKGGAILSFKPGSGDRKILLLLKK